MQNITNVNVELIRQPKGPNWPTVPPPSPQFGQLVRLFLDVKNDVLAHITEPSNDDYDNGVSDNCDQNFGTFGDFGVKHCQRHKGPRVLSP